MPRARQGDLRYYSRVLKVFSVNLLNLDTSDRYLTVRPLPVLRRKQWISEMDRFKVFKSGDESELVSNEENANYSSYGSVPAGKKQRNWLKKLLDRKHRMRVMHSDGLTPVRPLYQTKHVNMHRPSKASIYMMPSKLLLAQGLFWKFSGRLMDQLNLNKVLSTYGC